jgi:hypothetical protein
MLPGICHSISDARKQLLAGHQYPRNHFSDMAAPERTMNATLTTVTAATTTTDRIGPRLTAFRQRPQQTRTQPAPTSTNIRRSRHHDIRTFSATTASEPTTNATHTATEEPTTSTRRTNYLKSYFKRATIGPYKETAMMMPTALNAGDRMNRPLPQSVPFLAYAPFASDFSKHEPS